MNFQRIIVQNGDVFSETEEQIITFILTHPERIKDISITDLAQETNVSKSTVLRFVQKLGFKGFSQFKYLIDWGATGRDLSISGYLSPKELSQYFYEVMNNIEQSALTMFFERIYYSQKIYLLYTSADHEIQAKDFAHRLLKLGIASTVLAAAQDSQLSKIVVNNISEKDLLIAFSTGNSQRLKEFLTLFVAKNIPLFSITCYENTWLTNNSDFYISMDSAKHSIENIELYSSGIVHLVLNYLYAEFVQYVEKEQGKC